MALGEMTGFCDILQITRTTDNEGFTTSTEKVIASVRCYREYKHGSEKWANLSTIYEVTDLFRIRKIPGITLSTNHVLVCGNERFDIISVENIKGKSLYYEILAKKEEPSSGKV